MISGDFLYKKLDAIKAGKVLLLLNACYSGGVMATLSGSGDDQDVFLSTEPLNSKQIDILRKGKGFCVLSAAQASEMALTDFESKKTKKRYSPFTIGLSRGFSGIGSKCEDGYVRYGNLVTTCSSYLGAVTNMKQTPHMDFKGENFTVGCFTQGAAETFPMLGDDLALKVGLDDPDDDNDYTPPRVISSHIRKNKTNNNNSFSGTFSSGGMMMVGDQSFGDHVNFGTVNTNNWGKR